MTTSESSPIAEGDLNIKYRVTFKPFNISAIFRTRKQDQTLLGTKYNELTIEANTKNVAE